MAEFVLITEDCEDCTEDSTESHLEVSIQQIRVVVEETDESLKSIDNEDVNSTADECTEMTLITTENESETYSVEEIQVNPDDLLPPVVKLEKYATSDVVFNRQVVARNLLETLRVVHENQDEVARVIDVLYAISVDIESSVKSELMEQFPHIVAFCAENPATLGNIIPKYLVPIILNYLGMENNEVQKSCYSTLLFLVKRRLLDMHTVSDSIFPLLLQTTEENQSEEQRTEAVLYISKLVVLLGKEATEKLFLARFCELCSDESLHVRKACADGFGDLCGILGKEITERILLSKFFSLCRDGVWGVRKSCAEVFMPISCICSMETRHKELANVFISLLCDQSRWVRTASFQTLGPFISTFAKPDKTGLYYTKNGVLTIMDVPYSPIEESETSTEKKRLSRSDMNNSETDSQYSSLDRTTTNDSCDNVVPLGATETTDSTTEVPHNSCHMGNFCTVIEVSSSDVTGPIDNSENPVPLNCDDTSNNLPVENGIDHDDTTDLSDDNSTSLSNSCENDIRDLNCKYTNHINDSSDGKHDGDMDVFKKLWSEVCSLPEGSALLTNGDLSSEISEEYGDRLIENHLGECLSETIYNTRECESEILSTVTVNGVNVSTSVALSGPLNCEALPTASTTAEDNKSILTHNANSSEDPLQSEESSTNEDVEHSNSVSCLDEQNSFSMVDQWTEADSHSDDVQPSACEENIHEIEAASNQPSDNESAFNHFQYWRTPLPEIDVEIVDGDIPSSRSSADAVLHSYSMCDYSTFERPLENFADFERNSCLGHFGKGKPTPKSFTQQLYSVNDQDIVPPQLLLRYLSMTELSRAQTVDTDIARHCAYSLPAVALTLGRKFWPCLKETYHTLAYDMQGFVMQWKIRRTLASSMHQIAVILGPDITAKDLVPIFSSFIRDLDEVRIGILQHLAEFLNALKTEDRRNFLPQLSDFLISDNERNWRFRLVLAEQLIPVGDLYAPEDVRDHLIPLSLNLVLDKVSEVRMSAVRLVAIMMRRLGHSPTQALTKSVLTDLAEKFIHSPKWLHRQIYVYLCQEFISERSLLPDQFAEDVLPHLLYLCWDRVPNVRIAIARCLAAVVWPLDTFSNPESPHRDLLLQTIHTLQSDVDADVRYFANMVSTLDCTCLQHADYNDLASESFI